MKNDEEILSLINQIMRTSTRTSSDNGDYEKGGRRFPRTMGPDMRASFPPRRFEGQGRGQASGARNGSGYGPQDGRGGNPECSDKPGYNQDRTLEYTTGRGLGRGIGDGRGFNGVGRGLGRGLNGNGTGRGLGRGRERLLSIIKENENISQSELAKIVNIRPQSLSEIVNKLVADGYVIKNISPNDKRATELVLTDEGKIRAQEFKCLREEYASNVFSSLTPEEKEQLVTLLQKIKA